MNKHYDLLVLEIAKASDEGVTLDHAERVAGQALFVMNSLSEHLKELDKDRRMRKRGLKAIKSAVRMEEIKKHDKKPTESFLEDTINLSPIVASEEESFDNAEVETEEAERQYSIAKEAHLYFRSVSRGS